MATCPHLAAFQTDLRQPRPSDAVYREDCTLCFDSIDNPNGLDVCLHCFNGGCAGDRSHGLRHAKHSQHPLALNIRRTRKRKERDEPPEKMSKLEIKAETDADRYDITTGLRCHECGVDNITNTDTDIGVVVDGILKANTFAQQEEVKAWELELETCEHILLLQQEPAREIPSGDLGHCNGCELNENLWLCLTCGNLGCGRRQFGGTGGNNHGVEHTQESRHPVAVKLGSLTAEGNADIYCYSCDEERIDADLVAHLANWHIDISGRVKTEKSLAEMNLEQNLNFDFSMTDADGRQLQPLFGPGLTGLQNLGNTCYLASVLQALFDMPEFAQRYHRPTEPLVLPSSNRPAEDLEIQLRKVADGLLSGRYSKPDASIRLDQKIVDEQPYQRGLAPAMLKHLVGRGHAEFSTSRQQDAFELLLHLLQLITRSQSAARTAYPDVGDPVDAFRFVMEQKLQCLGCGRVRLRHDVMENISVAVPITRRAPTAEPPVTAEGKAPGDEFEPVTLQRCLDDFTASEVVELKCPACEHPNFTKSTRFHTFPRILAVNARRFEIVNWVPTKQPVAVLVPDEPLDMEPYRASGMLPDEETLPDDKAASSTKFVPNEAALEMLTAMGFPQPRCEKALKATGNADVEAASQWLFAHMEDPDIDEPFSEDLPPSGAAAVDPALIENLANMGFSAPQARQALRETGSDIERAVDWLFSHPDAVGDFGDDEAPAAAASASEKTSAPAVTAGSDARPARFALSSLICHKGSSIHAGHYVAFVRKPEVGWVLFNDEKVALGGAVDEMKQFAYVYFFRRQ